MATICVPSNVVMKQVLRPSPGALPASSVNPVSTISYTEAGSRSASGWNVNRVWSPDRVAVPGTGRLFCFRVNDASGFA